MVANVDSSDGKYKLIDKIIGRNLSLMASRLYRMAIIRTWVTCRRYKAQKIISIYVVKLLLFQFAVWVVSFELFTSSEGATCGSPVVEREVVLEVVSEQS